MAQDHTLITLAPTGAEVDKAAYPSLPVTLEELVDTAVACEALGAAIIHVHLRDEETLPTLDMGRLKAATAALREQTSLIVQLSSGGATTDSPSDRLRVLHAQPEMASCTMGTVNFGEDVFFNSWSFIVELHTQMQEYGIVAEYEIFDIGQLATLERLLDKYGLPAGGHVHCDLVMGVPGGMPGDPQTFVAATHAMKNLPPDTTFSATGIGRSSVPVMLTSLASGGHLRVGMEDTVNFTKRQPVTGNAQLVTRAAQLAELAGRPPMSAAQARMLLAIPG